MNITPTLKICAHCQRPIGGIPVLLGGNAYHYECTQSPYANTKYQAPFQQTKKEG